MPRRGAFFCAIAGLVTRDFAPLLALAFFATRFLAVRCFGAGAFATATPPSFEGSTAGDDARFADSRGTAAEFLAAGG